MWSSRSNLEILCTERSKDRICPERYADVLCGTRQSEPLYRSRSIDSRIEELAVVRDGQDIRVGPGGLRRSNRRARQRKYRKSIRIRNCGSGHRNIDHMLRCVIDEILCALIYDRLGKT